MVLYSLLKMKTMKKNKSVFQQPDLSLAKQDTEKADKLFANFYNGCERQIQTDAKAFSTWSMIQRLIKRNSEDPSNDHIIEVVKRMERDKLTAPIAAHISTQCQTQAQQLQKTSLIKMIPFFLSAIAIIVLTVMIFTVRPLAISNPDLLKFAIPILILIPVFIWGLKSRSQVKIQMLVINILMQASSAYASAKIQGKGTVGALQNLEEMRRRAKSMDQKSKTQDKNKKLEK